MLKNMVIGLFLLPLLVGCWNSKEIEPQRIYVDNIVYVFPPDSLLIAPEEPQLSSEANTFELIDWAIDLRSSLREAVRQLEGIKDWKSGLEQE